MKTRNIFRELHFLQCWEVYDVLSRDILATFSSNGEAMVRAKATSFTTDTKTYLIVCRRYKYNILQFNLVFSIWFWRSKSFKSMSFLSSWCLANDGLISNFRCQLFSHKATLGLLYSPLLARLLFEWLCSISICCILILCNLYRLQACIIWDTLDIYMYVKMQYFSEVEKVKRATIIFLYSSYIYSSSTSLWWGVI